MPNIDDYASVVNRIVDIINNERADVRKSHFQQVMFALNESMDVRMSLWLYANDANMSDGERNAADRIVHMTQGQLSLHVDNVEGIHHALDDTRQYGIDFGLQELITVIS